MTILTMGAKSSAFTRAAARTMDHEEWMQLPSKEAYKLWLLCMMEIYTLLEIFLDDKDPSLMAGIAINDGRGLWLRLMRRFFAPDQDKAAAVEKEIRALRQDVGTPQNWETVDELMMRFTALCRKYRQFSRILADGTRHCFQDDKHLQRDLLIFRTAPRYKRVVTHIITEENKTKKFNNGIPILWSIDDIRTELRDTEEAERSLQNKLHMRPVIGTTRLPNGKTGTANSAFDMSGYTDVQITDVTDQEAADEANFGEDMERKPVGSFPKGSCKHHPLSTTHDTKMCSKEQNNHGDGGGTDGAQKKKLQEEGVQVARQQAPPLRQQQERRPQQGDVVLQQGGAALLQHARVPRRLQGRLLALRLPLRRGPQRQAARVAQVPARQHHRGGAQELDARPPHRHEERLPQRVAGQERRIRQPGAVRPGGTARHGEGADPGGDRQRRDRVQGRRRRMRRARAGDLQPHGAAAPAEEGQECDRTGRAAARSHVHTPTSQRGRCRTHCCAN